MSVLSFIAEDRSYLEQIVSEYINGYNRDKILVIKAYPGIGKTISSLNTIYNNNLTGIYLSPTHNLTSEISLRYHLIHMKGKSLECKNQKLKELGCHCDTDFFCRNYCQKFRNCDYYLKLMDLYSSPKSWVGVHSHIPNLFNKYTEKFREFVDVNVVDESFYNYLIINRDINKAMIQNLFLFCRYPELTYLLQEFMKIIDRREELDEEVIKELVLCLNVDNLLKESKYINEQITNMYLSKENLNNFSNIIPDIISLRAFLSDPRHGSRFIELHKDFLNLRFYKKLGLDGSLILLDATFESEINKRFFPESTNFEIVQIKECFSTRQKIYQFHANRESYFTYSMNSLYKDNNYTKAFYNLCKIVSQISQYHDDKKILLVARKKHDILNEIQRVVKKPNIFYANFGGIRGTNKYIDCDVGIIFGTPFPNPVEISRLSSILDINEDVLYRENVVNEMIQDSYRIRMLQKEKSFLYVLSSVKIFDDDQNINYITPTQLLQKLDMENCNEDTTHGKIRNEVIEIISKENEIRRMDLYRKLKCDIILKINVIDNLLEKKVIVEELKRNGRNRPTSYLRLF